MLDGHPLPSVLGYLLLEVQLDQQVLVSQYYPENECLN